MKKAPVLILLFFVAIMVSFIYTDNPYYYQKQLYKKARCYRKQFHHWQDAIQDKLSF